MDDTPELFSSLNLVCSVCGRVLNVAWSSIEVTTLDAFRQVTKSSQLWGVFDISVSGVVIPQNEMYGHTYQNSQILQLLQIASDVSGVDHPLCKACFKQQMKQLTVQALERELEVYKAHVDSFGGFGSPPVEKLEHKTPRREIELTQRIEEIRQQRRQLKHERQKLEQDLIHLQHLEVEFRENAESFLHESAVYNEERACMEKAICKKQDRLLGLQCTNSYDDLFHIYYDGYFATINNFRLGKLPSQNIDWNEINASLGEAMVLLDTMATRFDDFQFERYHLLPMGNFSRMGEIGDAVTYQMYGSNDLSFNRLGWHKRFDKAIVWFLDCIQQLGRFAVKRNKNVQLGYQINGDKIGENRLSVKIQINNEKWTKAMKYMLTNLKFLLAWYARTERERAVD